MYNYNLGIFDRPSNIGKLEKKICRKMTRKQIHIFFLFFCKKLSNFLEVFILHNGANLLQVKI